ncbi:hypothetical protein FJ936_17485 [Mesorhizobium sp. B2-4-13]|uniref:hypothetical protein n=1 Tax=Mesorhizobium sp. B2-4-13 TaxID=2589936 RepID=UPI00116D381F|nr:hypothetical protein [Mesorhizobium sp. B2-4-13]TPK83600.1 hypothetical protein FJ936_17485 [Mesorhizobium sp. B2-4-13]
MTGSWSKGTDRYPVTLKKIASLDDTGEAKIDGTVEISFWAQTATDRFSGIYTNTSAGLCMKNACHQKEQPQGCPGNYLRR